MGNNYNRGRKVNVLFGKDPKLGSNHIENHEDRICFNGRNDPLFKEGINLIRKNLESEGFSWETGFFELQMNYMLLWSAIDRYCKLKYNQKNEYQNRVKLSKEKIFKEALIKYTRDKKRAIYSTDNLSKRTFDVKKPIYCLNYYYTLRCNIVHRGKTSSEDIHMLKEATRELLDIFEYILDNTFKE